MQLLKGVPHLIPILKAAAKIPMRLQVAGRLGHSMGLISFMSPRHSSSAPTQPDPALERLTTVIHPLFR